MFKVSALIAVSMLLVVLNCLAAGQNVTAVGQIAIPQYTQTCCYEANDCEVYRDDYTSEDLARITSSTVKKKFQSKIEEIELSNNFCLVDYIKAQRKLFFNESHVVTLPQSFSNVLVTINAEKSSNDTIIVDIEYTGSKNAILVVEAYMEVVVENDTLLYNDSINSALKFLSEQISETKKRLDDLNNKKSETKLDKLDLYELETRKSTYIALSTRKNEIELSTSERDSRIVTVSKAAALLH